MILSEKSATFRDHAGALSFEHDLCPKSLQLFGIMLYRRLADHRPEHGPWEPTPRQVPPPELPDSRPLPLAFRLPEATLTVTAPLPDTVPRTGMPPEPVMLLPWISTPKPELGSQAPRCVMICTLQLPSNDSRACAAPAATAAAIAMVMTVETPGGDIIFMASTFDHKVHNLMTRRSRSQKSGADSGADDTKDHDRLEARHLEACGAQPPERGNELPPRRPHRPEALGRRSIHIHGHELLV
jgi:hypothetical protein